MFSVLMIKPRWSGEIGFMHPITPPLGLLYLAAFARQERPGSYVFKIVDERLDQPDLRQWNHILEEFTPDLIAISALNAEAGRTAYLTHLLKAKASHVPIVLGGPYPTSVGRAALDRTLADLLVVGEGEIAFLEILDHVAQKSPDANNLNDINIPGVLSRSNASLKEHEHADVVVDMDELPYPAFDLLDLERYYHSPRMTPLDTSARYLPLCTSRGCPYNCIYCYNKTFGRRFRAMSAIRIVNEIEHLIDEYGVHDFEVFDDIFNMPKQRVLEICGEISKRGLKTRFSFPSIRGDILDPDVITALKSVGTYFMGIAVESASNRIQKMIHKNLDLDLVARNIETTASSGIITAGLFMLGFPTETRQEVWKTIRFALDSRLHMAFFFIVTAFEGTELYEMLEKSGRIENNRFDEIHDFQYARHSLSEYVSPLQLSLIQSAGNLLFYMNPIRALRILRDYPVSRKELLKIALGFGMQVSFFKPMALLDKRVHVHGFSLTKS
ncbi:MAG: B12-binding domain-containing radical SAM protein [Deltaproteobacteria bacterium]|nr:B12-binding domain-containing radical SAM protein [Deltaproteobacteria bacterium]